MDKADTRKLIRYIEHYCWTTLSPRQVVRLENLKNMGRRSLSGLRTLYRIAIDNNVFPECPYCKQAIKIKDELTIDHIIPKALGGTDNLENLQPMHKECNSKKGCEMPANTECTEIPVKKHRKKHNDKKHKQRESIRCRSAEEMNKRCIKLNNQNHISKSYHGHTR